MKKRIFIGSSLETKSVANIIKESLSDKFECVLWYEDFFSLGEHYYTDLIQRIITFDYAIMVGGEDDLVTRISTKKEKISPRDNIYLEYGLFSGILSPAKVLLLLHKNCIVASDLFGMSLSQYETETEATLIATDWVNLQENKCTVRSISRRDIGLLPTVGIAVGYYYNFVKPFIDRIALENSYKNYTLTILIPTFVCDDISFYKKDIIERFKLEESVVARYRILLDSSHSDTSIMYDVPSSILSLFKTVNYIFGITDGNTADTICAKQRALDDFYDNLHILISNDHSIKRAVKLCRYNEYD